MYRDVTFQGLRIRNAHKILQSGELLLQRGDIPQCMVQVVPNAMAPRLEDTVVSGAGKVSARLESVKRGLGGAWDHALLAA